MDHARVTIRGSDPPARSHTGTLARLRIPQDFDGDTPYYDGIEDTPAASVGAALEALNCPRR